MDSEMQTCSVCGSQVPAGSRFCANCGHSMVTGGESAKAELPTSPTESGTPPQGSPTVNVSGQHAPVAPSYSSSAANTTPWQPGQYGATPQPQQASGQTTYIPPQTSYPGPGSIPQSNLPVPVQSYSQAPLGSGQQYTGGIVPAGMQRDPMIALVLELVGYLFVLGLGHMYAGRVGRGITLLLGYWLYWGLAGMLFLTVLLSPIACLMALLHPVVPILSGLWAKRDLDRERALVGGTYGTY